MTTAFARSLSVGQLGESKIAQWLNRRGWAVLPVYDVEMNTGKGPRLFAPDDKLIALDMFAFHPSKRAALWIEAKHKTVFTWHRISRKWTTGIDLRHYGDYLRIADMSPWPVWLLFLHSQDRTQRRDEPWPCPTGLFGQTLDYLRAHENHRHENWGRTGMVYWAHERLVQLATLAEINGVPANTIPF